MKPRIKIKHPGKRGWALIAKDAFDPAKHEVFGARRDDMAALRGKYQDVFGKRPFMGWDAATIRSKIAEAD